MTPSRTDPRSSRVRHADAPGLGGLTKAPLPPITVSSGRALRRHSGRPGRGSACVVDCCHQVTAIDHTSQTGPCFPWSPPAGPAELRTRRRRATVQPGGEGPAPALEAHARAPRSPGKRQALNHAHESLTVATPRRPCPRSGVATPVRPGATRPVHAALAGQPLPARRPGSRQGLRRSDALPR